MRHRLVRWAAAAWKADTQDLDGLRHCNRLISPSTSCSVDD